MKAFLLSLVLVGCASAPLVSCATVPTPPTPAYPAATYDLACKNLADLGCSVGDSPECATMLELEYNQHLTNIDVGCLAVALSKVAAVLCGGVTCQ